MRHLIREVYRCQRGKVPEILETLKAIDHMFTSKEVSTNGKIYVDLTGPMDTAVWECEVESLDKFYNLERGVYVDPDAAATQMIDHFNSNTVHGSREIYEVII